MKLLQYLEIKIIFNNKRVSNIYMILDKIKEYLISFKKLSIITYFKTLSTKKRKQELKLYIQLINNFKSF
jgi:hypothetical protein